MSDRLIDSEKSLAERIEALTFKYINPGRTPLLDVQGHRLNPTIIVGLGEHGRQVIAKFAELEQERYDTQAGEGGEYYPIVSTLAVYGEARAQAAVAPELAAGELAEFDLTGAAGGEAPAEVQPSAATPAGPASIADFTRQVLESGPVDLSQDNPHMFALDLLGPDSKEPTPEDLELWYGPLNVNAQSTQQRQFWNARFWKNVQQYAARLRRCLETTHKAMIKKPLTPWQVAQNFDDSTLNLIIVADLSDPLASALVVDAYVQARHTLDFARFELTVIAFLDNNIDNQNALNAFLALYELQEFSRLEETAREKREREAQAAAADSAQQSTPSGADEEDGSSWAELGTNLPRERYLRSIGGMRLKFPDRESLPFNRVLLHCPLVQQERDTGHQAGQHSQEDPAGLAAEFIFHCTYSSLFNHLPVIKSEAEYDGFGFINFGYVKAEIPIDQIKRYFVARHGVDCLGLVLEDLGREAEIEKALGSYVSEMRRLSALPESPWKGPELLERLEQVVVADEKKLYDPGLPRKLVYHGFDHWRKDRSLAEHKDFAADAASQGGSIAVELRSQVESAQPTGCTRLFSGWDWQRLSEVQSRAAELEKLEPNPVAGISATSILDKYLTDELARRSEQAFVDPYPKLFRMKSVLAYVKYVFCGNEHDPPSEEELLDNIRELFEEKRQAIQQAIDSEQSGYQGALNQYGVAKAAINRVVQTARLIAFFVFALVLALPIVYKPAGQVVLDMLKSALGFSSITPEQAFIPVVLLIAFIVAFLVYSLAYNAAYRISDELVQLSGQVGDHLTRLQALREYAKLAEKYPPDFLASIKRSLDECAKTTREVESLLDQMIKGFYRVIIKLEQEAQAGDNFHHIKQLYDVSLSKAVRRWLDRQHERVEFDFLDEEAIVIALMGLPPGTKLADLNERALQDQASSGLLLNALLDRNYLIVLLPDPEIGQLVRFIIQTQAQCPPDITPFDYELLKDPAEQALFRRNLIDTVKGIIQPDFVSLATKTDQTKALVSIRGFLTHSGNIFQPICEQLKLIDAISRQYENNPAGFSSLLRMRSEELVSVRDESANRPPRLICLYPSQEQIDQQLLNTMLNSPVKDDAATPITDQELAQAIIVEMNRRAGYLQNEMAFERCRSPYLMLLYRFKYVGGIDGIRALRPLSNAMLASGAINYLGSECHPAIHYHDDGTGIKLPGYDEFYDITQLDLGEMVGKLRQQGLQLVLLSADTYCPYTVTAEMLELAQQAVEGVNGDWERCRALFKTFQDNFSYDHEYTYQEEGYHDAADVYQTRTGVCIELAWAFIVMARAIGLVNMRTYSVDVDYQGNEVNHACAGIVMNDDQGVRRLVLVDPAYYTFDVKHQDYEVMTDREVMNWYDSWMRHRHQQAQPA
ncbi:transglutaminase domain-containing protein [bacterium]|nr:transglutaminase domain-containing protein [bacterium]